MPERDFTNGFFVAVFERVPGSAPLPYTPAAPTSDITAKSSSVVSGGAKGTDTGKGSSKASRKASGKDSTAKKHAGAEAGGSAEKSKDADDAQAQSRNVEAVGADGVSAGVEKGAKRKAEGEESAEGGGSNKKKKKPKKCKKKPVV